MGGGIAACAIAIVLAACSNSEYDGRVDTVYSLDAPSVSAKAYPGVNIISWKPVTGASSYKLAIYEDGVKMGEISNPSNPFWHSAFLGDKTFKFKSNQVVGDAFGSCLMNGKKYTYYVEAVSSTNPGTANREVYAKNNRGEASATAIVPLAGTSALLLPAFEGGYDGKEVNVENAEKKIKDDKFVVSSENISVSAEKSNIYINFPAKAYLGYGISLLGNDLPDEAYVGGTWGKWVANFQSNNTNIAENLRVFSPGEYKVKISVRSLSNVYDDSGEDYSQYEYCNYTESVVESNETVTIESLGLSDETGIVTAKYLSDGKTAQVSFEPAKKDEVYVPASWYKVYRHVKGEYTTTEVTTGIKEMLSATSKKTYYVEDAISDNKQVYEYIVVIENDGKYGTAKTTDLKIVTDLAVEEPAEDETAVTAEYLYNVNHFATGADNTVRISFTPAKKDGNPVPTNWYEVYRNEITEYDDDGDVKTTDLAQTKVTSDSNKIMLDDADPNTYVIYDKSTDIDPAKGYVYTVVVENDGNFKAVKGTLGKQTKGALELSRPSGGSISDWNDYKWTFSAYTSDNSKAISGIKEIKAYLLVTSTTQANPEANEVIANGTEISVARDTEHVSASNTRYYYTFAKSALSTTNAKVSVVVTAKCDGYKDAVSEVITTQITKPAE